MKNTKLLILFLTLGIMLPSCFIIKGHDASIFYTPKFPCKYCKDSSSVAENAKYLYRKRYGINPEYFRYDRYDYKIHVKEYGNIAIVEYESTNLDSINLTACQYMLNPRFFILKPKCKVVKYDNRRAWDWNYNNQFADFGWNTPAISNMDMSFLRNCGSYNQDTLFIDIKKLNNLQTILISGTLLKLFAQQNIISNFLSFLDKDAQKEIISNPQDYLKIYLIGQLPNKKDYESFYIAVDNVWDESLQYNGYLVNVKKNKLISIIQVSKYIEDEDFLYNEYAINSKNGHYMVNQRYSFETNDRFVRSFTFDNDGHVSVK
ncbi:MAG: hypothetical protein LBK03_07785 [Bacteroidales bacterium]|nr:hypothetical protein [Bacteroidales bacterium]